MRSISRRDFLKLFGLAASGMAFTPFLPPFNEFEDRYLVRVATKSVSVYSKPDDTSEIEGTWFRDDLVTVYDEVNSGTPAYNPIWYRVWGGYMHRARLQKVQILYNEPLSIIPEGTRRLGEVTVPYAQVMRYTKANGWQSLDFRLYYESVHWMDGIEEGLDGKPWYRVFDELVGTYYVPAIHMRPIPPEELDPITPDVPFEDKRIEVNLTTQELIAYEYNQVKLHTKISSGLITVRSKPKQLSTTTPTGEKHIEEKMPSKHMGDGNLAADIEDYELPGVPWTCFFTPEGEKIAGYAFHGTYWHDNFGNPMSHGCINMQTPDAKWLFRWARPPHKADAIFNRGFGTLVKIFY